MVSEERKRQVGGHYHQGPCGRDVTGRETNDTQSSGAEKDVGIIEVWDISSISAT